MKSSKHIYSIHQHLSMMGGGRGEATHHSGEGGRGSRAEKDQKPEVEKVGKRLRKVQLVICACVCLRTVCTELPLCSGQCSWKEGYCLDPPAEHLIKE